MLPRLKNDRSTGSNPGQVFRAIGQAMVKLFSVPDQHKCLRKKQKPKNGQFGQILAPDRHIHTYRQLYTGEGTSDNLCQYKKPDQFDQISISSYISINYRGQILQIT